MSNQKSLFAQKQQKNPLYKSTTYSSSFKNNSTSNLTQNSKGNNNYSSNNNYSTLSQKNLTQSAIRSINSHSSNQSLLKSSNSIFRMFDWDDMNIIIPATEEMGGLYLGNISAAKDVDLLKRNKISGVLTVANRLGIRYNPSDIEKHDVIPVDDIDTQYIAKYFERGIDFIDSCRKQNISVLVHCYAGISRSTSIILAYLMKKNGFSYSQAYSLVQSKRYIIQPNPGFVKQLKDYEKLLQMQKHQLQLYQQQQKLQNENNNNIQTSQNKSSSNFFSQASNNISKQLSQSVRQPFRLQQQNQNNLQKNDYLSPQHNSKTTTNNSNNKRFNFSVNSKSSSNFQIPNPLITTTNKTTNIYNQQYQNNTNSNNNNSSLAQKSSEYYKQIQKNLNKIYKFNKLHY